MDSIFVLDEGDRTSFLRQMMQSFGCVYICVWSYLPPPSKCLLALDGLYGERSNEGSLGRRLFEVYRESVIYVDTGRIPGIAFKNNIGYMEVKVHDFPRLVSGEVQLQFYREAGIKTVVLMGCATGEIELGLLHDPPADLEKEMNRLVSLHLPQYSSCSSSTLHSLSVDSPDNIFNNIPSSSSAFVQEAVLNQPLFGEEDQDQAKQALSQMRSAQLPTIESEDAAMTKAILAVLSNSPPSQNLPSRSPTAFTRYRATAGTYLPVQKQQNKFKRAVLFFRNLSMSRRRSELQDFHRPNVTQLHHMISERRRREKLNESFHLLRSLLPPGSKKDKASVLSSTTEYLSSLKSQVAELMKKNEMLESQFLVRKLETRADILEYSERRVNVEITEVSSSTSEARFLDLRISVGGGESRMLDLISRLLELLKQQRNVSLVSLQSTTTMSESVPVHGVIMRLKIEGDEFDDSGFEESVRRVADDQTHTH